MRIRIQLFTTKGKKEERPEERENTLLPGNYLNFKRTETETGDNIYRPGEEVSLTSLDHIFFLLFSAEKQIFSER